MKTVELIYVGADVRPESPDFQQALAQTLPRKAHLLACRPDDEPALRQRLAQVRGQADRWVIAHEPPGVSLWPFTQQNDYPYFEFDRLPKKPEGWSLKVVSGELFQRFAERLPAAADWQQALLEAAQDMPAFDGRAHEALPGARPARKTKTFVVGAGKFYDNKMLKWLEKAGVYLQHLPKNHQFWRTLAWGEPYPQLEHFDGLLGWTLAPMWRRMAREWPDARWLVIWPKEQKWLGQVKKLWRAQFGFATDLGADDRIGRFAQVSLFGSLAFLPPHLLDWRESWRRELLLFQDLHPGQMRFFDPQHDDWDEALAWVLA